MAIVNLIKGLENVLKVVAVTESVARVTDSSDPAALPSGEEREMTDKNKSGTLFEEIELEAKYLVRRVRELMHEGNVRKLVIRDSKGKYLIEIPMSVGVMAGGVFVLYAPVMTALSMIAAAVTNVKIEVVRTDKSDRGADSDQTDEGSGEE